MTDYKDAMPIAIALGFTSEQIDNYLDRNITAPNETVYPTQTATQRKATYALVADAVVVDGISSHNGDHGLASELGRPVEEIRNYMSEIRAGILARSSS